jgi:L-alanine-DL-glutamate epimerase-like enolase superfamily enzyme
MTFTGGSTASGPAGRRWADEDRGYLRPPAGPGWGAEWDMRQFNRRKVEEF